MTDLALTPAAAHEVWRLWTGHLTHYGPAHLMLNLAAAVPPLVVLGRRALRLGPWLLAASPFISLVILQFANITQYRGASALIVGLWVMAAMAARRDGDPRVGLVFLLLVTAKLIIEVAHPMATIETPLPLAHFAGALAGWGSGLRFATFPQKVEGFKRVVSLYLLWKSVEAQA
jgi:hypothetical protein